MTTEMQGRRGRLNALAQLAVLWRVRQMKACELSLAAFVKAAWHVVEPNAPLVWGWHMDVICEYLEAVTTGRIKRLIINIPPRMSKSLLVSVFWPAWEWLSIPGQKWVFVTYADRLTSELSMKRRGAITSDWYQSRWGERIKLANDQNQKTEFQNTQLGSMYATTVGGALTGRGGNRIVIDDPHNTKEALSDAEREHAIDFFRYTLSTRLDDPKKGAIVLIMQRLHESDLTGYILAEHGAEWTHVRLPMVASEKEIVTTPAGNVHVRQPGEYLCHERFGPDEVLPIRRTLGAYGASGQLDQRPAPAEGGLIKRHWFRYYDALPALSSFDAIVQSWDFAFKDKEDSDFVVGQVWGQKRADYYLLDEFRDRMDFVASCHAIEAMTSKWPDAVAKLVEDKANGPAVISALRNRLPGLIPIEPRGSKEARLSAVSPAIESGNVYLPAQHLAPWIDEFVEECCSFPKATHDDRVDAMSQALDRFLTLGGGLFQMYMQQAEALATRDAEEAAIAA